MGTTEKVITAQEMFPVSLTLLVVPSWHCSASLCGKAINLLILYPAELWLFETVRLCCIFKIFVFKYVLKMALGSILRRAVGAKMNRSH